MNQISPTSAFALLRQIETRSQQRALGLPQKTEVQRTWSGVGFRLGSQLLLTTLGDVTEILKYPSLTRIPSALRWVRGLANIRGNLLPIMDLSSFLQNEPGILSRTSRILVVRHGELISGLLVDEVFGMRHFFAEEHSKQMQQAPGSLGKYLQGTFKQNDATWSVFNVAKLTESNEFLNIAARI